MKPTMIIPGNIKAMLDDAIHSELYASNLYKHIANSLQKLGYFGAQKFFLKESAAELDHYQLHVQFQNDIGAQAKVPAIEAMDETITGLVDAIELGYETELDLYNDYKKWYAGSGVDPVVQQFLLQFLELQRTSVGEYGDLLARLALVGDDKAGLILIDQELGG